MQAEPWYNIPEYKVSLKKAVVIGGGLAGTSSAYSLAKRGWKVTIIERTNHIAAGASGNQFGIITPLITHENDPIGKLYSLGFEYSLAHFARLKNAMEKKIIYKTGVLELSNRKACKNISSIGYKKNVQAVTKEEASELSGVLLHSSALYLKDGGYVSPHELCNLHIKQYESDIDVIYNSEAVLLQKEGDAWLVQDKFGQTIADAPVVIIANAADAKMINESAYIPLVKVRGQITYADEIVTNLKTVLCYDGGYILPGIDGINYIGATYKRGNFDLSISMDDHIENLKNLSLNLDIDKIDVQNLSGRASFRATLPDRRPVVGALPDIKYYYQNYEGLKHGRYKEKYPQGKYLEGLYISTGFGSRGLSACPIAGELIAAAINGEKLPIPYELTKILHPARFIINSIRKIGIQEY